MKTVFDVRLDKYDRARRYESVLFSDAHARASTDYIVYLVFIMRLLTVCGASRQNVKPGAHGRYPQELEIGLSEPLPLGKQVSNFEEVIHWNAPLKKISVY